MEDLKDKKALTTALVPGKVKKNALDILAARLDLSPAMLTSTLKATAFSLCKDDAQFVSAVVVANTYGLNPLLKEMYAFPSKGGGIIPIVGIDGWIKLVNRQNNYDGVELIENKVEIPNKSATTVDSVTAKFYLKDREHPVVVTEYMEECYDGTKEPWKRWPRRMLRHKAYIQGARIAFGFSGIYDEDEKDRIIEAEAVVTGAPIVGLKHDKTTAGQVQAEVVADATGRTDLPASDQKKEPDYFEVGNLERFGQKEANSAKFMAQNVAKCAQKIGKEAFMKILGENGVSSLQEVLKLADLVKITNLAFEEVKKLEGTVE